MSNEPVPVPKTEPAPAPAATPASNSSSPTIAKDNEDANTAKKVLGWIGLGAAAIGLAAVVVVAALPAAAAAGTVGAIVGGIALGAAVVGVIANVGSGVINYLQENYKEAAWDFAGAVLGAVGGFFLKGVDLGYKLFVGISGLFHSAISAANGGNEKTGADKVTPPSDVKPNPTPDNDRKKDALDGKPKVIEMEPLYITVPKPKVIEMEPVYITGKKPPETETPAPKGNYEVERDGARESGDRLGYTPDKYANEINNIKDAEKPMPNSNYVDTSNGDRYITDDQGRIKHMEGVYESDKGKRDTKAQREAGGEDRLSKDHGGHFKPHIAGGYGGEFNLTAMDGNLNQGEYKRMEDRLNAARAAGNDVYFQATANYDGNSKRPSYYDVNYIAKDKNGNKVFSGSRRFYNESIERREIKYKDAATKLEEYDNSTYFDDYNSAT